MYINIILLAFGGGILRGIVGYVKHQYSYKNVKFEWKYFLVMTAISGLVGLITAIVVKELELSFLGQALTPALAFVIGYAGGDFLENIYKIVIRKPSLYSLPEDLFN